MVGVLKVGLGMVHRHHREVRAAMVKAKIAGYPVLQVVAVVGGRGYIYLLRFIDQQND